MPDSPRRAAPPPGHRDTERKERADRADVYRVEDRRPDHDESIAPPVANTEDGQRQKRADQTECCDEKIGRDRRERCERGEEEGGDRWVDERCASVDCPGRRSDVGVSTVQDRSGRRQERLLEVVADGLLVDGGGRYPDQHGRGHDCEEQKRYALAKEAR